MNDFALTYDDVTLRPKYSHIKSRRDPDPATQLMGMSLKVPILSANMDTITEHEMAIAMANSGAVGVLHRFMDIDKNVEELKKVYDAVGDHCMVSIGAKDWQTRAKALHKAGATQFVIDIAHGHSVLVEEVIKELRSEYGNSIHIMMGNIATAEGVHHAADWGADSVKVGVGGGSICTTRLVTGFGVPMFSSVLECSKAALQYDIKVVADGGLKTSGDIVKAFVAGAHAVMVGRLLAGTYETPGSIISGTNNKSYRGMSSASTRDRIGSTALAEGIDAVVALSCPVEEKIADLVAGIKSGMSYGGASTLKDLTSVEWMRQTPHGAIEGTPHILR